MGASARDTSGTACIVALSGQLRPKKAWIDAWADGRSIGGSRHCSASPLLMPCLALVLHLPHLAYPRCLTLSQHSWLHPQKEHDLGNSQCQCRRLVIRWSWEFGADIDIDCAETHQHYGSVGIGRTDETRNCQCRSHYRDSGKDPLEHLQGPQINVIDPFGKIPFRGSILVLRLIIGEISSDVVRTKAHILPLCNHSFFDSRLSHVLQAHGVIRWDDMVASQKSFYSRAPSISSSSGPAVGRRQP
ncbi:hypothetical protein ASPBRDRAFT_193149 [Aspergillus brasiliensis CBS 101740]|uniref:Uncharacterized protein n=1 Tax=Aspergillus brasiliensis (strain CBS 101740 / IMI 381727 / IBT 21946) TaxID=767769 RepID=A0A1L9URW5_ASPBC|nr:hypothetical protein ASPBRDRAFT_193149 [Aspergillus brasiliensis CBS 101740]